jgi:hypothetical protein
MWYTLCRGYSYAVAIGKMPGDGYDFHWQIATLYLSYWYISDDALTPYMFGFEILSHIAIQSLNQIHRLTLQVLRHYHILLV